MISNFYVFIQNVSQVDLIGNAESDATEIVIEEGDKYVAVFDPLDGSSNVDAGIPTGTIIGVRRHLAEAALQNLLLTSF